MSVKRIKNLVKQLNEYRHAYYNQDAPLVSDAEYDRLFDELKELEEQTGFILSNSPTQTVGYYPVSELAKVTHPIPLALDGYGEKSFDRLWESINASRRTSFVRYLVSMDIPMIGRTKSRILDTVFSGNLTAFEQAAVGDYDFTQLEDFGEILNHNIHSWFADEANLDLWKNLQNEFTFEQRKEETIMTKENKFTGCTIVATGKLEHFTRDGINDKILELGAKPGSSVTKKTDYLICGEKAGSKLAKAQSLGIPILTEAEFLEMIA